MNLLTLPIPARLGGRGEAVLAFLGALALFGAGAGGHDLWRTDEHRYVEVAREMTTVPGAWIVPHLNGSIYRNKPPGYFWSVAAAERALGLDLRAAALLPSVLAGAGSAAAIWAIGQQLYGPLVARLAAFVFVTSAEVLSLSTRGNLDALLSLFTTLSLFFYARSEFPRRGRALQGALVGSALCAGLGVLVKGPVALAVPGVVMVVHRLLTRSNRPMGAARALLWLLLGLAPAALWLMAAGHTAGWDYVRSITLDHGIGHPLGLVNKQRPPWFYGGALLEGFLPWSVFLPATAALFLRLRPFGGKASADRLTVLWAVAPLLLLSLFPAKRHLYLLPLYPGMALLVARTVAQALEEAGSSSPGQRLFDRMVRLGQWGFGIMAGVVSTGLIATVFLILTRHDHLLSGMRDDWPLLRSAIDVGPLSVALGGGVLLFVAGVLSWRVKTAWAGVGMSALLAALLIIGVVHPVETAAKAPRSFFASVEARIGTNRLVSYGCGNFSLNWLLRRDVVPILSSKETADAFLESTDGPVYFVGEKPAIERMGMPKDATVALHWPRALAPDLLLLVASREHRPSRERQ